MIAFEMCVNFVLISPSVLYDAVDCMQYCGVFTINNLGVFLVLSEMNLMVYILSSLHYRGVRLQRTIMAILHFSAKERN